MSTRLGVVGIGLKIWMWYRRLTKFCPHKDSIVGRMGIPTGSVRLQSFR